MDDNDQKDYMERVRRFQRECGICEENADTHAACRRTVAETVSTVGTRAQDNDMERRVDQAIARNVKRREDGWTTSSDFNPDNTMDYIRYLMKKINRLEADVAELGAFRDKHKNRVAKLCSDMEYVKAKVAPKTALDRKIADWFASGENRLPDDDDPWWNMP